jgi:lambda family phage tail tape measure protein
MSDVASLSVALHLNSAAFKSQITDAYQKAGQASKKFNDQATAQANELSEAIARTVSAAKNIGMQGNESGQFSSVTRGAGQLNFVLHEVAAGSNVASSTIINALIPAVHSLKGQLDGSAGGWKTQQDAARNAAAELAAAAQSQIAAAQAEKQAALNKAAIAEKTIAAAQAQREEAIALDEYYAKQTQMNKLYGLNVSYQEQHLKNERAIIEANRLESGALEKLKTVKATVMAADLAEAEGKAALVASTEAAAAANTQMTISQRIAATSSRALSSAMSLLGGPVGIGLSVLAAGGTLIYSEFKKAEEQTKKLNTAILDLHTSSLVSLTDLKNLNNQLGDTDASIDAVTATAKAGFSGHLLTDVATLANAYAEAGGSAQDLVNNLSSLRGDPIAAMEKLTSQGVALNESIIQQVISLTKKGQTAQATQVIMEQALEAENVRLKELGAQADTYLDKLKNLGREWGALGGLSEAVAWGDVLGRNQKDFEDKTRQFLAASKAGYAEAQSERIKNAAGLKSYMDAGTSAAEKRAAAIKKLNNSIYQPDSTDYQRILKGINDEYEKSTKKPKASASAGITEGQRALEQAQQRNVVLLEQAQTTDKQTESQRQLIIFEQKISSLKGEHLTADQQSLVNMQAQIRSQLQSNVQLEKEAALRQTAMKYQQESIKWAEEADAMQREAALAVEKFGMSEREAADAEARNAIINRFNQRRIALEKDFTDHTSAEYQTRLADLENAQQRELQITEQTRQQKMAAEQDFSAGLRKGAVDWLDSASSYATQSANLVSNTMSGFVDQLSGALSGNKASWQDWANSVLQSMQKVILNAMLVNSIQSMGGSSLFGFFGGGSGGTAASASGGTFGAGAWDSAASGVKFNAKGGVYDSPSLSSYSNGVFNSPQVFAFAKGAGVFAEAGPEAIMPLARGANGSLGVRAVDAGGSNSTETSSMGDPIIQITQHISVSGNGDAALNQAMQEAARKGAQDGAKLAHQKMLEDFQNRGQGRRLLGV